MNLALLGTCLTCLALLPGCGKSESPVTTITPEQLIDLISKYKVTKISTSHSQAFNITLESGKRFKGVWTRGFQHKLIPTDIDTSDVLNCLSGFNKKLKWYALIICE